MEQDTEAFKAIVQFLFFYAMLYVVIQIATTALRCAYWKYSKKPEHVRLRFKDRVVYTRILLNIFCIGGFMGTMFLYYVQVSLFYSVAVGAAFCIVAHLTTTKAMRRSLVRM